LRDVGESAAIHDEDERDKQAVPLVRLALEDERPDGQKGQRDDGKYSSSTGKRSLIGCAGWRARSTDEKGPKSRVAASETATPGEEKT
jgi:hypothetical protein